MTQIFAFIPKSGAPTSVMARVGGKLLEKFKNLAVTEQHDSSLAYLALAPRPREDGSIFFQDESLGLWLTWTGTWFYRNGKVTGLDGKSLLKRYREVGVRQLSLELEGQFAIIIGDNHAQSVQVITDRCGSIHVFTAETDEGVAVSSSSGVLAAWLSTQRQALCPIDAVGLHQFIATGIIYDDLTLWADVKKVASGVVYRIQGDSSKTERYWHFADLNPESLNLDDAVERVHSALVTAIRQISNVYPAIVSDLTGGYDSRLLLSGLLSAGVKFETTVSGPSNSQDVRVATEIADAFGIDHVNQNHVATTELSKICQAVAWADGEYEAIEYSQIGLVQSHSSSRHQITLNGSFGELARGYWWELIWPKITERAPLSGELISQKRFAAVQYEKSIFSSAGQLNLQGHLADVLNRTIRDLKHFPKSTQMDALYYYQRMDHWQGRIVSATNHILPCLSPFSFPSILEPILEAKASARIRSLLPRALFERFHPELAAIPMEHGNPPRLFKLNNALQFLPLIGHYAQLVKGKLGPRLKLSVSQAQMKSPQKLSELFPEVVDYLTASPCLLVETGLFDEGILKRWFHAEAELAGHRLVQWKRLLTVEILLRQVRMLHAQFR